MRTSEVWPAPRFDWWVPGFSYVLRLNRGRLAQTVTRQERKSAPVLPFSTVQEHTKPGPQPGWRPSPRFGQIASRAWTRFFLPGAEFFSKSSGPDLPGLGSNRFTWLPPSPGAPGAFLKDFAAEPPHPRVRSLHRPEAGFESHHRSDGPPTPGHGLRRPPSIPVRSWP